VRRRVFDFPPARAGLCLGVFELAACQLAPPAAVDETRASEAPTLATSAAPAPDAPLEASPDAALRASRDSTRRAVVTWNLQWFLDPTRGPTDDARQLAGARAALEALAPDLLALQELSSAAALAALLEGTPLRAAAITAFEWPQQLAIACSDQLQPTASRVLDELSSAGRAPLEVELEDRVTGAHVVVIAVHAKAYADDAAWRARRELAEGLHAYVQARWSDQPVILLGDLNDGLTRSIVDGEASPYASFVSDPRWAAPTVALERAEPSRGLLDHVLVSDELAPRLGEEAAERLTLPGLGVESSASAVSDHAPIRVRLDALGP
jgi:endonuclease/exonuclease/phosphatase family metal-dependent hydrolase